VATPARPEHIARDVKHLLANSYPNIKVRAEPWSEDPSRIAIYFTEEKFVHLYPKQRYHYLVHLIPDDYFAAHLENAVWFELAPGKDPAQLQYPDDEPIADITPAVMKCLIRSGFFGELDDVLCPEAQETKRAACWGDYRNAKSVLLQCGFKEEEFFEVFHVLMELGGYCDCEILYNAVETSRLKAEYWMGRAKDQEPYNPHTEA
jgi:hypothetical protein